MKIKFLSDVLSRLSERLRARALVLSRVVTAVLLIQAVAGACWGRAVRSISVRPVLDKDQPAIVRETPDGRERMLVVEIGDVTTGAITGATVSYEYGGHKVKRILCDVAAGEVCSDERTHRGLAVESDPDILRAYDTLWLPEPVPARVRLVTLRGNSVWADDVETSGPSSATVVIPCLPRVKLEQLKPLVLRGTNYLPRHNPWPGIWREMNEAKFESEFKEMDSLCINALRTFLFCDREAGLVMKDGCVTPRMIQRINTFLSVADMHAVRVMLCLYGGDGPKFDDLNFYKRYLRSAVEPFRYDGRVLAWDLINEPGGSQGPSATPELARWLQVMYGELEVLDPEHILTVGLCWQFKELWDLGVRPPLAQYHDYSGAIGVLKPGAPHERSIAEDLGLCRKVIGDRPLVIGEFGGSTRSDETSGTTPVESPTTGTSEVRQLQIYRNVLDAAEAAQITGVFNWVAFEFSPHWVSLAERTFGVIRLDGTLKPAGDLLRNRFRQWRETVRAPWER